MRIWIGFIWVAVALCCGGRPAGVIEVRSLDEATTAAARHNSLILIEFSHPSCIPCKHFEHAVKEDSRVRDALAGCVLFVVDSSSEPGERLARLNGADVFPTFAVFNAKQEVLGRWVGYDGVDSWLQEMACVVAEPLTVAEREARFATTPSFNDAITLGKSSMSTQHYADAERYFRQALELDTGAADTADVRMLIFRSTYFGVGTGEFTGAQVVATIDETLSDGSAKPEHLLEIAERLIHAIDQVGEETVAPLLRPVYELVARIEVEELQQRKEAVLTRCMPMFGDPGTQVTETF